MCSNNKDDDRDVVETSGKYYDLFEHKCCLSDSQNRRRFEKALEKALDIRKFEIELYWKRATYFWVFVSAAFVGYLQITDGKNDFFVLAEIVALVGFVVSFGWYLANRGSKYWQENWEKHVDMLENRVYGPLYKTVLNRDNYKFCKFMEPYRSSVSKINQFLSIFIMFVWFILLLLPIMPQDYFNNKKECVVIVTAVIAVIICIVLFSCCKTGKGSSDFNFKSRKSNYKDS